MNGDGHHWLRQPAPILPSGGGRCPQKKRYLTRVPARTAASTASLLSGTAAPAPAAVSPPATAPVPAAVPVPAAAVMLVRAFTPTPSSPVLSRALP
ncbi:hypothetical protein, partial [Streptomyces daghestanicus]|uniref:hypothetical protein n=1 Tax=Streptomyces daghestanicus TaxID=66885 RepID=UPI0035714E8C